MIQQSELILLGHFPTPTKYRGIADLKSKGLTFVEIVFNPGLRPVNKFPTRILVDTMSTIVEVPTVDTCEPTVTVSDYELEG